MGLRNNQFEGAYLRFTDDLTGTMIQARNRAIDDQTQVRVEVSTTKVEVFWIDPEDAAPGRHGARDRACCCGATTATARTMA